MSENFQKVKRKLMKSMNGTSRHTPHSWADIMLKAAERCVTSEDQKDFYRFILNPDDSWDVEDPTFIDVDQSDPICLHTMERMTIFSEDDEKHEEVILRNTIKVNGGITYISTIQEECKSS